ncbi:hypothetical protein [Sedimentibacter sp.]|uniref:hypothetical protein n=1 Tax=Sedimentibacter sp. TaxID=1960295 RepID=UPI00289FDA8C|nr:hypothetical protein [Sedimentibacter sp.]
MRNKLRKTMLLALAMVTLMSNSLVYATSKDTNKVDQEFKNPIIIRDMQDLEEMRARDLKEYNDKMNSIPAKLKNDFNNFEEMMKLSRSNNFDFQNEKEVELYVDQFILAYPDYAAMDREELTSNIELLRANIVVTAVRAFFSSNGYDLALDLFNHSLTENPAPATLELTGNYGGMYSHIRTLLRDDGFVSDMVRFAREGSNYKTLSDSSRPFENGDLYWAIHGFTWKRTRTNYDRAYFNIIDVYDFNKWKDIPGIVAGLAGTNDFDIEISGLVEGGTLK